MLFYSKFSCNAARNTTPFCHSFANAVDNVNFTMSASMVYATLPTTETADYLYEASTFYPQKANPLHAEAY